MTAAPIPLTTLAAISIKATVQIINIDIWLLDEAVNRKPPAQSGSTGRRVVLSQGKTYFLGWYDLRRTAHKRPKAVLNIRGI